LISGPLFLDIYVIPSDGRIVPFETDALHVISRYYRVKIYIAKDTETAKCVTGRGMKCEERRMR